MTHTILGQPRRFRVGETVTVSPGDGTYRSYGVRVAGAARPRAPLHLGGRAHGQRPRGNHARLCAAERGPVGAHSACRNRTRRDRVRPTPIGTWRCPLARPLQESRSEDHHRGDEPIAEMLATAARRSCRTLRLARRTFPPGSTARADTPRYAQPAAPSALQPVTAVIIGPEGGFSDRERAVLESCPPLVIGNGVLRTETACIVAVSALLALRQCGRSL